jgi:phosphohistidine phosphatase
MDLIIWRHAEAQDKTSEIDDLDRALTSRGEKQAARMAIWLDRFLPEGVRILCSPALRCEQTVMPLGREYQVRKELAPDASVADVLSAVQWPSSNHPVLIVGHQPVLGDTIARLLDLKRPGCPVKKGAVWWIQSRVRGEEKQNIVLTVQSPDLV